MKFLDNSFLIYDSISKIRGDDLSLENLERLEDETIFSVDLYPNSKMLIPKIDSTYGEKICSINNGYITLLNFEGNPNPLTQLASELTIDIANILIDVVKNVHYRTANVKIKDDITDYLLGNVNALAEYKNQKYDEELRLNAENKTLFQASETDKLFIELPPTSLILSYIDDNVATIPPLKEVCVPYPSILYYTSEIKKILAVPVERRLIEINKAIISLQDQNVSIPKNNTLAKDFKILPESYIFGNQSNDNLPIQENEIDYYNALITFIKYHINLFNSSLSLTDVELKNKNKKDYDICNLPKRLEAYLSSLLEKITVYHYRHTGHFKLVKELDLGEDNGGYAEEDDDEIQLGYMSTHRGSDANIDIEAYINLSGKDYSASVWAEAIIKLCRWGSRKPESLAIGDKNKNICNLETMQIKTAVVNLSEANKVVYEDNRSYTVIGYAMNTFFQDNLADEMPSLLILEEFYSNPENEEDKIRILSLVTFQDMVTEYKNGRGFIHGIEYNSEGFVVDSEYECLNEVSLISLDGINQVPVIKSFMDFCSENDISNVKGMSYAFVHSESLSNFIPDTENYLEYIAKEPAMIRYNALYGSWLSVFDKTSLSDLSIEFLSEYLNEYTEKVYERFNKLLIGDTKISIPSLSKSIIFDNMNKTEENEEDMINLFNEDLTTLTFTPIISRKPSPNNHKLPATVGFVANSNGKYIFASLSDNVNYNPLSTPVTFVSYALLLFGASIASKIESNTQVISNHTLPDIYNSIARDIS